MPWIDSVSVLVCSFNRAALLQDTLASLAAARPPDHCDVDIIVIDNNSTDDTADVVRTAAARGPWPVRYALEQRQGKGYALNRGLSLAAGDVLALTDDDVLVAGDWLVRIVEQFRSAEIVFAFGKVLPRWQILPPPELLTRAARDIWGPLALVDYGDHPIPYDTTSFAKQRLPIGANLAVRRDAIVSVGGWRTDLGKIDNSLIAGEDHELCVRLYRAGMYAGLYDPALTVRHLVPASRLTRQYFRRWFYWHGRTMARMADAIYLDLDFQRIPYVAGVPRFIYRELLHQAWAWLSRTGRSDALALLIEELKLIEYFGFLAESWKHPWPLRPASLPLRDTALGQFVDR